MDTTTHSGTPLRQRMLDDMRMRKMAEHTQEGYIRAVRKLAGFLGRSPDTATIEELNPQEVWITHGREDALMRWCEMRQRKARPLHLVGYGDEENEQAGAAA